MKIKALKLLWPVVAIVVITGGLIFAEWWATRRCCGNYSFLIRADCCAAGRDCSKVGFCPAAKAPPPPN